MSYSAECWAKKQKVGGSSAKSLLKTYAEYASEDYTTWVNLDTLVEETELNRKTCIAQTEKLVAAGWLRETSDRRGRTNQIVVYQMLCPPGAVIVEIVDRRTGERTRAGPPDADLVINKESQKRNSSKNGTVPKTEEKGTGFSDKQYQKRLETVPKTVPDIDRDSNDKDMSSGARGTRLPKDWGLPKTWGEWALIEQPTWSVDHVRKIGERFGDYWVGVPGHRGRKTDWPATWRNWVRAEKPAAGVGGSGSAGGVAGAWWESSSGIERKGAEMGITQRDGEVFPAYKQRVYSAAGDGPWNEKDRATRTTTNGPISASAFVGGVQ